jgi:putative glycosyltransferase
VEEFYRKVCGAAEKITSSFEIIFVNDGSPDNSLEIALSLYRTDRRIKIVNLSRNFGHHKALMTGLDQSAGELIFLIDSDLEEEPELLDVFYKRLKDTRADVVFGVQKARKGKYFERVTGALFFKIFNLLSTHPIPTNHITARLMSRRYVTALLQHREREFIISGLWTLTGFEQVPIAVKKHHSSRTTYGPTRKIAHLVNAITSFSSKPLVLIFYLGCFILLLSSVAALDMIVRRIILKTQIQGWSSLIVSVWLLGGMTIFCLGVIGIYLSKIFLEVKRRPYTIIKEIFENDLPDFEDLVLSGEGTSRERKDVHELR